MEITVFDAVYIFITFLSQWKTAGKGDMKDNATVVDVVSNSTERGEIITWHLFLTKLISHLFPPATHVIEI